MSRSEELFTELEMKLMEWAQQDGFEFGVMFACAANTSEKLQRENLAHSLNQTKNGETEAERIKREAGPRNQWQPIENCPEETPILVLFHSSTCASNKFISEAIILDYNSKNAKYGEHNPPWFFCHDGKWDRDLKPVYWMPLPEPPEAGK